MRLDYFEALDSAQRVLLICGDDPSEVATLQTAVQQLASGVAQSIKVDQLPGIVGVNDCALLAETGTSSLGVIPIDGANRAFRCVLDQSSWRRVSALLDPFAQPEKPPERRTYFQYLTSTGAVEWIISTAREW